MKEIMLFHFFLEKVTWECHISILLSLIADSLGNNVCYKIIPFHPKDIKFQGKNINISPFPEIPEREILLPGRFPDLKCPGEFTNLS